MPVSIVGTDQEYYEINCPSRERPETHSEKADPEAGGSWKDDWQSQRRIDPGACPVQEYTSGRSGTHLDSCGQGQGRLDEVLYQSA